MIRGIDGALRAHEEERIRRLYGRFRGIEICSCEGHGEPCIVCLMPKCHDELVYTGSDARRYGAEVNSALIAERWSWVL